MTLKCTFCKEYILLKYSISIISTLFRGTIFHNGCFFPACICSNSVSDLEMMHRWWQSFSRESEAFFSWVCDSKRELDAFGGSSANLDEQIHTVEVNRDNDLDQKTDSNLINITKLTRQHDRFHLALSELCLLIVFPLRC